jgi:hypothetical protein
MSRAPQPPPISRRAFLLFALLAPASFLAVIAIILVLQYRQFQTLVSPQAAIEAPVWSAGDSARHEALKASLLAFGSGEGPDTLFLSPADLTLLASGSSVAISQGLRFRIVGEDSLLASESARRLDALRGRFAGLFNRMSPIKDGWLNARVEGTPELKNGALTLAVERGFLNGAKVPRAALEKHGGLSPRDFLTPEQLPAYTAFLAALDTVSYGHDTLRVIRKKN